MHYYLFLKSISFNWGKKVAVLLSLKFSEIYYVNALANMAKIMSVITHIKYRNTNIQLLFIFASYAFTVFSFVNRKKADNNKKFLSFSTKTLNQNPSISIINSNHLNDKKNIPAPHLYTRKKNTFHNYSLTKTLLNTQNIKPPKAEISIFVNPSIIFLKKTLLIILLYINLLTFNIHFSFNHAILLSLKPNLLIIYTKTLLY